MKKLIVTLLLLVGVSLAQTVNTATLELDQTFTGINSFTKALTSTAGVSGLATLKDIQNTTFQKYIELANTGNSGFYFGTEGSVGGAFFSGSQAYDSILYSPANDIFVNTPLLRMAHSGDIGWRNLANNGNITLGLNSSDILELNAFFRINNGTGGMLTLRPGDSVGTSGYIEFRNSIGSGGGRFGYIGDSLTNDMQYVAESGAKHIFTGGIMQINNGVFNSGTGLKHVRSGNSCTTAASVGATCNFTVDWPGPAFADSTSYTVTCSTAGVITGIPVVYQTLRGTNSLNVFIVAMSATAAQASEIDCIAMHD